MQLSWLNEILAVLNTVVIVVFLLILIYHTIYKTRNYFSSAAYIAAGILIPLILYFRRWSYVISQSPSNGFYWIFISLFVLSALFQAGTKRGILCTQPIEFKSGRFKYVSLVNYFWYICFLLNNKYCSGLFFPSLSGVDIHVQNAPIIGYFIRASYAVIALDILTWYRTGRRKYIIYALLQIILPVVTSSSRMAAVEAAVCGISFFLFLHLSGYGKIRNHEGQKHRFKWYQIVLMLLLVGLAMYAMILAGIYRASHFGKYTISYAGTIGYTGPFGEVGAWLYGYFALSINNLNQSIISRVEKPNFIGLYSFASFYFGVLQLDNIFGINSGVAQHASAYTLHEATVPTGLWTFYYDFSVLAFIPMLVAFIKELWIRQKIWLSSRQIVWCAIYFFYIPEWFFMGFTNTIFSPTGITTGVIIYFLLSFFFQRGEDRI